MLTAEAQEVSKAEINAAAIREQLELLVQDPAFRSSKRSVQFLRYVVQQTLEGSADQIKERTIGVEVFGRSPAYDTNQDHVVRTAAIELRKRLAVYYGEERHRSELRMTLVPGSYIPHFSLPSPMGVSVAESEPVHGASPAPFASLSPADDGGVARHHLPSEPVSGKRRGRYVGLVATAVVGFMGIVGYDWLHHPSAQDLFWKPVMETPGFVLLAAGDVPDGPPTPSTAAGEQGVPFPIVHKTSSPTLPFADAVTMARVLGTLESRGKRVVIRQEGSSSFSDLRESPVVLIGAFNNEWSLRLTRRLRYSLALDPENHLIYIKDAKDPSGRTWSWATNQPTDHQGAAGGPALQDFALISRIWNSDTGHAVIVIGGLYTYGTEAAGEFLTDAQMMQAISKEAALSDAHSNLQIVLVTTVTDGTAGPPRVLAVVTE
jgi:hypothetical protein